MTPIYRGATVSFSTTFYDASGVITQPSGASVNITCIEDGELQSTLIAMTPPEDDATAWTAQWDTRGVTPGNVTYSIHTTGITIPFAVQDGSFTLLANNANLPTF